MFLFYKKKKKKKKKIGDETNKNFKVNSVGLTHINTLTTQHAHRLIILNNHVITCEYEI